MANDEQILTEQFQNGNLEFFTDLYNLYVRKIYEFVYFKTHHKQISEDLTSEIFLKALENFKKYSAKKGKFSSWIYGIARNTVIDYYRTKKYEYDIADAWDLSAKDDVGLDIENKERIEKVRRFLNKLTSEQRDIIILRIWSDLPYREIAEIMGKTEANCKMIFSRALAKVRQGGILALLMLLLINLR